MFPIDSDLAPIDAEHMTADGAGISVDWEAIRLSVGWLVGVVEA